MRKFENDSDHATCKVDRRSNSCYHVFYNGVIVIYGMKKEPIVTPSSTAAEIVSQARGALKAQYLVILLSEILPGKREKETFTYEGDNRNSNLAAESDKVLEVTKHLEIKYLVLRQMFTKGWVERIKWIQTDENTADLGTKAVTAQVYAKLQPMIMKEWKEAREMR